MEEIQKSLLSVSILYPDERHKIFKALDEQHFTNQYRTIFKECKKLYSANKEIDPVIIVSNIGSQYMSTVVELSDMSLINKPNTLDYINILKNDFNRKQALLKNRELLVKIENSAINQKEIQDEYLNLSKLFNEDSKIRKVNMLQGFSELLDEIENKTEFMKTYLEKLDKHVLIDKGDYLIVGGRPSSGKTTFATNIMVNMSAKYNVDFYSLETNALKVFNKIAASYGSININKIQHKSLQETDYNNLIRAAGELSNYNLNVIEAAGMTVQDIISSAMQNKADIIFIDYLQLIQGKGNSLYEQTTQISKDLHTFAQKEKVTVVALAQLKRTDKKEPTMSDLRESGQIEQDADVILLMHDPVEVESTELNKQFRDLIIAKNKTGQTGKIKFNFWGGIQKFKEA